MKDDGSERRLIFTALQETFLTYLKVSFFAAFFVTCPFILTQIWKFIAPGLYKHEKIAILPYLVLTPILFLLGGMLVYYLIMPLAIKFFLSFESSGLSTNLPIQLEAKVNEFRGSGKTSGRPASKKPSARRKSTDRPRSRAGSGRENKPAKSPACS